MLFLTDVEHRKVGSVKCMIFSESNYIEWYPAAGFIDIFTLPWAVTMVIILKFSVIYVKIVILR